MASATTLNTWMEELALSFLPPSTQPADTRKHKDNFLRRVKNHGYGRTNQFAVTEKLIGLEEKFQVLNLDDLAGELFSRRVELQKEYDDGITWLPDVLDLLLHLSHHPAKYSRVEDLENLKPDATIPEVMRWDDVDASALLDRRDPIWDIPQYSDFSSDEEEAPIASSSRTSPASVIQEHNKHVDAERTLDAPPADLTSELHAAQFWQTTDREVTITEAQAAREVLFSLGGLPTSVFKSARHVLEPNQRYRIRHLEPTTSFSLLSQGSTIASEVNDVRRWLRVPQRSSVMQLVQDEFGDILGDFDQTLDREHTVLIRQISPAGVVSLVQVLERVRTASLPLQSIRAITSECGTDNAVTLLDAMYRRLEDAQSSQSSVDVQTLLPVFLSALTLYAKPVDVWLHTGMIQSTDVFFIIRDDKKIQNQTSLWRDWFTVSSEHDALIPSFFKRFTAKIFTIGKTAAFLDLLGAAVVDDSTAHLGIAPAAMEAANLVVDSPLPFSATFEMGLERHLSTMLSSFTNSLKQILETSCGLSRIFDAFDYLYLAKDGAILDMIESKIFDQIDHCVELWNDRFLLGDALAEAYTPVACVDADAISVHAAYTSSRTMENRRRSVKILGAVSVSYHISWPLANIILQASMSCYQRVALMLGQIRRAKYLLERRAYFHVQFMPLDLEDPVDTRIARLLFSQLALFVNVLYGHFTDCVVRPLTTRLRDQLHTSWTSSLDNMISIHGRYIAALDHACLSSKRMSPLREAVVSILDLCVRFTDLTTAAAANAEILPQSQASNGRDFEASSFISAQSRRRHRRRTQAAAQDDSSSSSSDDNDDDTGLGEGYSTFILDGESSLVQEILKVRTELKRHLDFLVAGLRAVARASSSASDASGGSSGASFAVGESFELLADSLEGIFPTKRRIGF